MNNNKTRLSIIVVVIVLTIFYSLLNNFLNYFKDKNYKDSSMTYSEDVFRIISSSENKNLEDILVKYAKKENIDLQMEYAGTIEIMDKLNSGEKYDAVWASNSIWLYMLNDTVKTSESKSTNINPVVFAINKSKANELGFIGKDIYTKDIVDCIKAGKLKFSMSNPTQTNTGATAYLGLLSTLAGNPEVLTMEHLSNGNLKKDLVDFFTGLERSSGSEDFLEELFLNGSYEAVVTYESSIININKQLESQGKEPLYVLYPVDGVSISDSPFAFIDNGSKEKKEQFLLIRDYILSNEGQQKFAEKGRRTWFGGVNNNIDKNIFNPEWGIDTTKYIVPIKFPSTKIIQEALAIYQTELRKPIHTVFCLDYSGSMYGEGYNQLISAMNYILNQEEAKKDLLQYNEKDRITVIPFSTQVINMWQAPNGADTKALLQKIENLEPGGSTNIYDTSISALKILEAEDLNTYNVSVILMTDGLSNMGKYNDLSNYYRRINKEIPIYSIMFGSAREKELQDIANLTNAKVFDGKSDLLKAFKEVRGYN